MAKRPVFAVIEGPNLISRRPIEFEYFNGFSEKQKRRSIESLHKSFNKSYPSKRVLEISSKSPDEKGVKFSAFNLIAGISEEKEFSVESAFQSSKVFEHGGPYTDLLHASSRAAKKDERLRNSGNVVAFNFGGKQFPAEPRTFFYNWLYVNALHRNPELAEYVLDFDAFTDIEFNPQRSINCQAEAAAIYVSLRRQGLLEKALADEKAFLETVYPYHTK